MRSRGRKRCRTPFWSAAETDPQGEQRHYDYDAAGRLVSEMNRDGRALEYGYDALGRTVTERWIDTGNQVDNTLSFTYDGAGRLLGAADPLSATLQRSYDAATMQLRCGREPVGGIDRRGRVRRHNRRRFRVQ